MPDRRSWRPKKIGDHIAFRASWMPNAPRAAVRAGEGGASQNIHTDSAMRKYRMGQTMGNAMRGGVHDGFAKLAYQVGISGVVTRAPINATL
jgi:hypothetical protein